MTTAPALPEITNGLYEIAVSTDGVKSAGACAYLLTQTDVAPGVDVTLESAWSDPGLVGWYLFLDTPVVALDAAQFVRKARQALEAAHPLVSDANARTLAWFATAHPETLWAWLPLYMVTEQPLVRSPIMGDQDTYAFDWPPLSLTVASGVAVTYDADAAALSMTTAGGASDMITLWSGSRQPNWYRHYPEDAGNWTIALPLTGPSPGALHTRLALDFNVVVQDFGCGMRFGVDQGAAGVQALAFPFYAQPAPGLTMPAFALRLHPMFPTDARHTRFQLDFGDASPVNQYQAAAAGLCASAYLTTGGAAITVAPCPPALGAGADALPPGFGFCVTPEAAESPAQPGYYLAPLGLHRITAIDGADSSPVAAGARWMCGLSGMEYLDLQVADLLSFETDMAAFLPSRAGQDGPLERRCTTAWLRFPLGAGERDYVGQPDASVYFGSVADGAFARPVRARLATLDREQARGAVFPMPPYGSLRDGAADAIVRLESGALTALRHASLTAHADGPVFLPPDGLLGAAGAPATAETRQGFLVHLDTDAQAGAWAELEFARSPDDPGQRLALAGQGSPAIVPKAIASQLLQDQLFMVISDASALGPFANELAMAGFNFRLAVGTQGAVDSNSTILILKYNTGMALQDLARDPSLWASRKVFVRDQAGTSRAIALALAAAAPSSPTPGPGESGDDPFANFRAIASDPAWTGMLALNCAIDGNGMPPDLQMLLGGIGGQLFAHHFGIQGNRIAHADGAASIAESSLFGVIAYPSREHPKPRPDPDAEFAYVLERLTVVFHNSTIQDFAATVGLTVNRLFGREVSLALGAAEPNTLTIAGHYQLQDGVATVTFASEEAFNYGFPAPGGADRVLRQVVFDSAALTPVSTGSGASPAAPGEAAKAIRSRFSLAGALWFNRAPFATAPGFDLFSYGAEPADSIGNGLVLEAAADLLWDRCQLLCDQSQRGRQPSRLLGRRAYDDE